MMKNNNNKTLSSIDHYLDMIKENRRPFHYFGLDSNRRVILRGGSWHSQDLCSPDPAVPLDEQCAILIGYLPVGTAPCVLLNLQLSDKQYFDLHLFSDSVGDWILLLDNRPEGAQLQAAQQAVLTDDLKTEGPSSALK